jgi:hypothetical protein
MIKLIKSTVYTTATILALSAIPARAADYVANQLDDTYRAGELSLDGFGTASFGKYTINHLSTERVNDNTKLGGGVGVNYFFTRNLGIGAEAYTESNGGDFVNSATANALLRLPLGASGFAPYALAGGGYRFDDVPTWLVQAGAGIEYRFCKNLGVFLDARCVIPEKTTYYGLARAGVRFAF